MTKSKISETFPHFKLIQASAGTGKTFILSKRISEFLLFDVPFNNLRNILAITFTVNASKEMKQRIIGWLKKTAVSDKKTLNFLNIPEDEAAKYAKKAEEVIKEIFSNFKDFQVKTIDSFIASIFKACAIEFGYLGDFDVALNNKEYLKTAFDNYLNQIGSTDHIFFKVIEFINENDSRFRFSPQSTIFETIHKLYVKERHYLSGFVNEDKKDELEKVKQEIKAIISKIQNLVQQHNVVISGNCGLNRMIEALGKGDFFTIFTCGDKNSPIKKSDKEKVWADELESLWEELKEKNLKGLMLYAEQYYYPYMLLLKEFNNSIEEVKQKEEVVFLEDIPSIILKNVEQSLIPDVYIRLGGRLYHYFIDEFQDTSPIQWANLKEFIENTLSQGGSLFVVGDTKQAIYGFRDTDYEIMNSLSQNCPFPSCSLAYSVESLNKNFRSGEAILQYTKECFDAASTKYGSYGGSGLFNWKVEVEKELENKGYVEAVIVKKAQETEEPEEKLRLKNILQDVVERGFNFKDIAILAHKNSEIIEISTWLNEFGYPFLSFSSLDVRERKVVKELIHLLKFLDSPRDNLSFAFFLKGVIFNKLCPDIDIDDFIFKNKQADFLYKAFQREFPAIWEKYFDKPFSYVGYLPIYELVIFLISNFLIAENFKEESGAVAKLLEILKDLESNGKNSLKEFLEFLSIHEQDEYESGRIFELPIPQNADAIKLMTVHKAKGLGFPVVLYFLYNSKKKIDSLKIAHWNGALKILKITSDMKKGMLKNIYDAIDTKDKINDLNSIYVALTRAKKELYVIGITNTDKDNNIKREFPTELIIEKTMGEKETSPAAQEKQKSLELEIITSNKPKIQTQFANKIAFDEKRRGEFIHLVISKIDNLEEFSYPAILKMVKTYHKDYPELNVDTIGKEIYEFLSEKQIAPFFKKNNAQIFVEKEFLSIEFGTIRLDRLILQDDKATIVDFKTGEKDEAYKTQLEKYAKVIKEIYNRQVECFILYFDKKEAVKVYEC